ncbi:MAG: ABC transporter substrate-binding protein, partial [Spirochaeta sp.]|nr:ABC transporter substrate-binding protein [Spirochaeta sp.]
IDLESVLARAADAEYWFNLNYDWNSRADVLKADPRLARFRSYQTRNMYHYNARMRDSGANDFWESGVGRPDLALADLVHIMHPDLLPDHSLVYYRKLES